MSRIFLSHSSLDNREAIALREWLIGQDPPLAGEIFLDLHHVSGVQAGVRWKDALRQANARCEAVICLLSPNWEASNECRTEYRFAEYLNKRIFSARIATLTGEDPTRDWQQVDLVGDGPTTSVDLQDGGEPVRFLSEGLHRLRQGIVGAGIAAETFVWPPPKEPNRAPYRGWEPLEEVDAAVFFGRDAQILRGVDALHGMRKSGETLFVVLGPSGTGKSSFLRAGLLPRLRRSDRDFVVLDIVRPQRGVLTGVTGLAGSIHKSRNRFGLRTPKLAEIKRACSDGNVARLRQWLSEIQREASARLLTEAGEPPLPTLVVPVDQAEELFGVDAGSEASLFTGLIAELSHDEQGSAHRLGLVVALTIRTDRYQALQNIPELADVGSVVFDELRPMPRTQFLQVITGPAARATQAGRPLRLEPALVQTLLDDCTEGADTLPLLALTLARLYEDYATAADDDADGALPAANEETPTLTVADYESMGGMRSVVRTEIDELLSPDLSQRQQELELLRSAFIPWLATINRDNDQPMRRLALWDDLPASSHPLLQRFVAKRLLIKDNRDGAEIVEVALESLLRQWDDLASWLSEERESLKVADALERAAADWQASGRNQAWLLEGSRLAEAEALVAKPGFQARLESTREFLQASRAREDARVDAEKRRQEAELKNAREKQQAAEALAAAETRAKHEAVKRSRILLTMLAVTLVIAVVAGVLYVKADRATNEANSRLRESTALRLVAQGLSMISDEMPGGEVLGVQQLLAAHELAPQLADSALADAVMKRRGVARILSVPPRDGQTSAVHSVAMSHDGRLIVAGSDDSTLRAWDAEPGAKLKESNVGNKGPIWSVAISPDNKWIAAASGEQIIQLWDPTRGEQGPTMKHDAAVHSVAFSHNSQRIVTGSDNGAVRIWDTNGKEGPKVAGHERGTVVRSVAFNNTDDLIASGGSDGFIRLWDANSGAQVAPKDVAAKDKGSPALSVAFSSDGSRIAVGRLDGTIQLVDGHGLQPLSEPFVAHPKAVNSVAFSPDGARIVSGSVDNTVKVWNAQTRALVGDPLTGHQGEVTSVAFNSADGTQIVSGSADGTVREWNTALGLPLPGEQGIIHTVAFSHDGNVFASGGDDGTLKLWDTRTVTLRSPPLGAAVPDGQNAVRSVAFSPDDSRIVSAGRDGAVRVWDLKAGKPPIPLPMATPDGQPVPGGFTIPGDPRIIGDSDSVQSVAFSQDGSRIISGGNDGALRMWNATSLQPIRAVYASHPLWSVAVNPNEPEILTASGGYDNSLQLWDANSLTPKNAPMVGHKGYLLYDAGYSTDGKSIVSGSNDGFVRVWNAQTREVTQQLSVDQNAAITVAFAPNGQWIVSGGNDNTLRLWDTEKYKPIGGPVEGHTSSILTGAVRP
ncbi:MAG: hypothetical protein QOH60_2664, partial [Mycobacterium sp.]|nr:hypothetical protein [Mycobacterium sp.]